MYVEENRIEIDIAGGRLAIEPAVERQGDNLHGHDVQRTHATFSGNVIEVERT